MHHLKMSTYATLLAMILACQSCKTNNQLTETDEKIEKLLTQMTLEEKIGQLNLYNGSWEFTGPVPNDDKSQQKAENIKKGLVGGMLNVVSAKGTREAQKLAVENSRLGIPLIFGYDVVHGYKTMAPIPLAQAASWDAEVAQKCSELAALEAAAAGLNWTFAPMVDISRDARWGRMMEGPGEDPFLASVMAKAWVVGFQGDDLSLPNTIAACAKHFAAYGFSEAGRDYNTADLSDQTLYNVVLPPFKAAADAGVATFMNSFNEIAGVPASGSHKLQREILKGAWNWKGFVVSDWGSIREMEKHGYASDLQEAGEKALSAGSDMDMESYAYELHLKESVEKGKADAKLIDDAVRRILKVKFDLGLFDDPYRYCDEQREAENTLTPENLAISRDAARKSIVLLKNENALLPLPKQDKKIAVIGSLANSKDIPLGSWRAKAIENRAVSLLEGIQNAVGESNVTYAQGYRLTEGRRNFRYELTIIEKDETGFAEAISTAKKADVVILALGEDCWQTGEGRSQADIGLKGSQLRLLEELAKVNKNIVVTLMNGRSLAIPEVAETVPALVEVWHLGSEAGNAIADVLFGDYNPSGKLPVSFPRHVGQMPLYYNHKNTGRPITNDFDAGRVFWSHYTDLPNSPLYPFGFGLSYSTFDYSDFQLSSGKMKSGERINATVSVKNTSQVAGTETVQLYVRDHVGSVTRPIKELKAFQKITLAPGETKQVTFEITEEMLSYYRADLTFGSELGNFTIMVGYHSESLLAQPLELL
jgi:beta-glucosidase